MIKKYSKLQLGKMFAGKKIHKDIIESLREKYNTSSAIEHKKKLVELLANKSELKREKMYKELDIKYKRRKNFEKEYFGNEKTAEQLEFEKKILEKRKRVNIRLTASKDDNEFKNKRANPLYGISSATIKKNDSLNIKGANSRVTVDNSKTLGGKSFPSSGQADDYHGSGGIKLAA